MAKVTRKPGPGYEALQRLSDMSNSQGRVGWFESAHYPDGTPVAYVAAIQEFGSPAQGIPPRLGLRSTAADRKGAWRQASGMLARKVVSGSITPDQAMEQLGLLAAGDIRKHISEVTDPPLKPATIERRIHGRSVANATTAAKPLVNTKLLLNSVTNRMVRKGAD